MGKKRIFLLITFTCQIAFSHLKADSLDLGVQVKISKKLMFANISRQDTMPGVIVASPSQEAPNYFFHWIRDAALTIDTVVRIYAASQESEEKKALRKMLLDYVLFSRKNQTTPNLSGGLGEPKFNVDGSAYDEPWGRPQSDGPALRAIALLHFANVLIEEGQESYVRQYLYDNKTPTESVIKADLEYLASNWQNSCFDIWEETRGNHFYTMMVQRRALLEGALFADRMGDFSSAVIYRQNVLALSNTLEKFWDPQGQFLFESQNQVSAHDKSGLDTAVILGVLHGYSSDNFYSPNNDKVLSTAMKLKAIFQTLYPINNDTNFATAIGRYAEDTYNGDGDSQGNPWFITTFAFADLFYRARIEFKKIGEITVTALNKPFLDFIFDGKPLEIGMVIGEESELFSSLLNRMDFWGDAFMKRGLSHAGIDGAMSEEINRSSGQMQGAENLTWSHASFLNAWSSRQTN
jgi:glucoamylase